MIKKALALAAVGTMLLGASAAFAAFPPIDLTAAGSSYLGADGAFWQNLKDPVNGTIKAGTGIYDPFLREQANGNGPNGDNGVEYGLNTDGVVSEPYDNVGNDPHTHSLMMGMLSNNFYNVGNGNQQYLVFSLDLNEPSGGGQSFISLDQLMIYTVSNAAGGSLTTLGAVQGAAGSTLRYNMDAVVDQTVYLDYNNSNTQKDNGSGVNDMAVYIPASYFAGASASDYLYFYAVFGSAGDVSGSNFAAEDGFEEWRADMGGHQIPEPGTLVLLGTGLIGLVGTGIRRKK